MFLGRPLGPLNEGWGFCPTDAGFSLGGYFNPRGRSTKGGASAPPTRAPRNISDHTSNTAQRRVGLLPHRRRLAGSRRRRLGRPLNEGWGFCPTDAFLAVNETEEIVERSTKGGASAPPTPLVRRHTPRRYRPLNEGWGFCPTDAQQPTPAPHLAPPAQRRVGLLPHRRRSNPPRCWRPTAALNEGWGFCPTDAVSTRVNASTMWFAQRRVGLLPHRRDSCIYRV